MNRAREYPKALRCVALVACSLLAACGSPESLVGVRPIPPAPADTAATTTSAPTAVTGAWTAAQGPGLKDIRFDLIEGAGGIITGTWSGTRLLCACQVSGTVYSNLSAHQGLGVRILFTVERLSSGELVGILNATGQLEGNLSLGYDFEPDGELKNGGLVLTR
jgi:hypothetical protein